MQPIRLKKRRQFVSIADTGRKIVTSGLVLQYAPNNLELNRVGFTVTKKVGKAVARNRVRRRLREVFRLAMQTYAKTGYDFVVIGRLSTIDRTYKELKKDLAYTLRKVE